jgi:hypothetical protein
MYDIFLVSRDIVDEQVWKTLKNKFPNAQKINNCKNIKDITSKTFTKLFWIIWDDLMICDNFDLTGYRATKWDDMYIHVFLNGDQFDGICLFPKNLSISQREFDNRFFVAKKNVDIVASTPIRKLYDIVFISYNEPNADNNFETLVKKFPRAKRINGIKGIHRAHIEAAKLVNTEMFYVVDGDAIIVDDFNFDYYVPRYERSHVHVWRSKNPINNLEYGYGGVKLLPTDKTLDMDVNTADMTTSISSNFKVINITSNITAFNTDPFNTWKSAFRECVKLSSRVINRQDDKETTERLRIWCEESLDPIALDGACAGRDYGSTNQTNAEALKKINDFDWLKAQFDAR